jgi:lysophospholipase L1-like esterase
MNVALAEAELTWAALVILAAISYPAPYFPGPVALGGLLLAFLPGAVVLSRVSGRARVFEGLDHLLSETRGRLSLLAAAVLVTLIGFAFVPFVAFVLIGLCCSGLWSVDLLHGSRAWERRLGGWAAIGLTGFLALAAVDAVLSWGPVARRLGTPAEDAHWGQRYGPDVWYRNFFRFRSPYEDTRRRPGVGRVIALGDSFTWGSHIASSDSTWPALLEQILTHQAGTYPTEVINMGRSGFATGNEEELLRRIGWQFDPDLVVVQWLDNDAYETTPNFGIKSTSERSAVVLIPPAYRTGWIRESGTLALLERALSARLIGVAELDRKHFAPSSPGWLEQQRKFREIADSASRHHTPVLLVLYPYLFPGHWTTATYPERDIHRLVAAAGQQAGLEVLDLLPTFLAAGKDFKDWWGTAYDSHPGSGAQLLAARTIASYIKAHRLLPDSTPRVANCRP